jgi:hypothetical protein
LKEHTPMTLTAKQEALRDMYGHLEMARDYLESSQIDSVYKRDLQQAALEELCKALGRAKAAEHGYNAGRILTTIQWVKLAAAS